MKSSLHNRVLKLENHVENVAEPTLTDVLREVEARRDRGGFGGKPGPIHAPLTAAQAREILAQPPRGREGGLIRILQEVERRGAERRLQELECQA